MKHLTHLTIAIVLCLCSMANAAEQDAVVKIVGSDTSRSPYQGSGVCVDPSGIILTVRHVVASTTKESRRVFFGEKSYPVVDSWIPSSEDVAVLKIDGSGLPYLEVAVNTPKVGSRVWGMGFAKGVWGTSGGEIVTDTVSFDRRGPPTLYGTSVPVDFGQSGGPLVDVDWGVVGILSVMRTKPKPGVAGLNVFSNNVDWKSGYLNLVRIRVAMAQMTGADRRVPATETKPVVYAFTPDY